MRYSPVFHGTNVRFDRFQDAFRGSSTDAGTLGLGFYFNDRRSAAQSYAEWVVWKKSGGTPLVIEATIHIDRPYRVDRRNAPRNLESDPKAAARFTRDLQRKRFDGIIHHIDLSAIGDGTLNEFVVFQADQIEILALHPV